MNDHVHGAEFDAENVKKLSENQIKGTKRSGNRICQTRKYVTAASDLQ